MLALVRALTRLSESGVSVLITGSVVTLAFGYLLLQTVGYLSVQSGLAGVGTAILAASRMLGASPLRTLRKVELLLLRRALLASILSLREPTRRYIRGSAPAVTGVEFTASRGEVVAPDGTTGCGKTTVLRLIAGLETSEAGEILIDGARRCGRKGPGEA